MSCSKLFCRKRCVFSETVGMWADRQPGHRDEGGSSWIFEGQRSFTWGMGLLLVHVVQIPVTDMLLPCYNHITFMHFVCLLHFSEQTLQM